MVALKSNSVGWVSNGRSTYKYNPSISVGDPNQLCSDPDPDPGSHAYSDPAPGSEQDPNKYRTNPDPT